ncbi:unnamed protein product [Bemisia tabaci]|uniref:Zinc finger MYND domain-containing protein 11 n=1 Tax=Bemisia tabaci TaxID=7038 RepID=A0A9P0G460_BEMTA|nr:PREDICTED: zinc finger MYND domain-containing protein 11-like [Bemisia tabaci]CAH0771755.1 unnamed protein product [Bemisia tabaci]
MNKKLFSAMSRRRISSPEMVQHLWDAVKVIRCQRQIPNIDRITRYMVRVHNTSEDEVARQLNYCVRDNLLEITKKVTSKGANVGLEQEGYNIPSIKAEKDGHDWYCLECHSGGDVISCNNCHRVYHLSCILKDDLPDDDVKHKFVCTVCKKIQTATEGPQKIKKSTLNRLLRYTCLHLKEKLPVPITERQILTNPTYSSSDRVISVNPLRRSSTTEVSNSSKWVLDEDNKWRIESLIYVPMDLQMMKNKASRKEYNCQEEFRADAQTLVHNVVIYHGVHSSIADMARQMLRDCDYDLHEIHQCFHCYRRSNEKVSKHWFCKPCIPPHELVYAKQKGFPYWPAKVIKCDGETYDVRFFGTPHERATIEKAHIRPISVNIHTLQVKRTSSWNKACEELKRHQHLLEKLRQETNNFSIVADSSSDSDDDAPSPRKSGVSPLSAAPVKFGKVATPTVEEQKNDSSDSSSSEMKETPVKKIPDIKVKVPEPIKKRKPGRPPRDPNSPKKVAKPKVAKGTSVEKIVEGLKKKRGRPKKAVDQESPVPETKSSSLSSDKSSSSSVPNGTSSERMEIKEEKETKVKEEKETKVKEEKSSPPKDVSPASRSRHEEPKAEEEEMVSSSCQGVESPTLVQTKSIAIQTNLHDKKPSKDWINKMRLEFEMEEKRTIERLEKQHQEAMELLREQHALTIADVKKKQWCYNCEMEAIYHCCWNTSYCSTECQQIHWQREHKRVCRRKR